MERISTQANNRLILIRVEGVLLFFLFMLSGTILCFVFVVGVAIVVVGGGVVVVVDVVVAALSPLFLCNHAQDHLAHLLTERYYYRTPVAANIPE